MQSNNRSFQRARFEVWIVWKFGFEIHFTLHKVFSVEKKNNKDFIGKAKSKQTDTPKD